MKAEIALPHINWKKSIWRKNIADSRNIEYQSDKKKFKFMLK